MSSILSEKDITDLKEGLKRCSAQTIEAAIRYREHGDLDAIPVIVYGVIERYQPANSTIPLAECTEETRLIEDLGLDSLTLMEIVLSIEEVLNTRIENDEFKQVRTLGQLNQFLRNKMGGVTTAPIPPAHKHYDRAHINLVLPQQPPFMFLDEAELNAETIVAWYTVKGDEHFLEGHFKDDPIFPASIVFEAMGQAACLWLVEKVPALQAADAKSRQILFASLEGAHFYQKTRPGDRLQIEQKLIRLREPLAIFEGTVSSNGHRVARVDRLVLAFGGQMPIESPDAAIPAASEVPGASEASGNGNGE